MPNGGKREGAGRKAGVPNKSKTELKALAASLGCGPAALNKLMWLMDNGETHAVQRAAASDLLDRTYGKAPQAIIGDKDNPLEVRFRFKLDRANADD